MVRPLATIAYSFSAALFLAHYVVEPGFLIYAAAGSLILALAAFLLWKKRWAKYTFVVLFSLTVGFSWRLAYNQFFVYPESADNGGYQIIYANALSFADASDTYKYCDVSAKLSDGKSHKATLYLKPGAGKVVPGDTLSFYGKIDAPLPTLSDDKMSYNRTKGIHITLIPRSPVNIYATGGITAFNWPQYFSNFVNARVTALFAGDTQKVMPALLTGNRDKIDKVLNVSLADTGLSHVVSVSGMHVIFLTGLVMSITGRRRYLSVYLTIVVIAAFVLVSGCAPPAVRAGIMQTVILLASLRHLETDPLTTLGATLMAMLALNPYAAGDIGLQLSFAAVGGIRLFCVPITTRLNKLLSSGEQLNNTASSKSRKFNIAHKLKITVTSSIATTLSATVFTLPIVAFYFGNVSIAAPLANVLALWAVSFSFLGGLIAFALSCIYFPLGQIAAFVVQPVCEYFVWIVKILALTPFASLKTANFYTVAWVFYIYLMALLYIGVYLLRKNKVSPPKQKLKISRPILPLCLVAVSLCVALILPTVHAKTAGLLVAVLDVGQGACAVVTSGSYTVVIDCGGNKSAGAGVIASNYLHSIGRTKIDWLILTHYHTDHANGVAELMALTEVRNVALPALSDDGDLSERVESLALAENSNILRVETDKTIRFSDGSLIELFAPIGATEKTYENEKGVAVMCRSGDFEMVCTGDINYRAELSLMKRIEFPDVEMLIAGHHGSNYSTDDRFLLKLKPEIAAISVGKNIYGHPSPETLERLAEQNVRVYRTDLQGTIVVDAARMAVRVSR